MGRKRNNGLSEEKRNIIGQLIEMYDIKTAADIQEALKDLLGGTIQSMLETELEQILFQLNQLLFQISGRHLAYFVCLHHASPPFLTSAYSRFTNLHLTGSL